MTDNATSGNNGSAQNSEPKKIRRYLDTVIQARPDDSPQWLIVAIGHDPHVGKRGKFEHKRWTEHPFLWPVQRDEAVAFMARCAPTADVYVCPYLMNTRERAKGNASWHQLVHTMVLNFLLDVMP